MIGTVVRIGLIELRRDRVALALTFLLPILFFSIFAGVFGQARDTTGRVAVAVVDEDGGEAARRLVRALEREAGLEVRTTARPAGAPRDAPDVPLTRQRAEELVRQGSLPVAIVLPRGIRPSFVGGGEAPQVEILADVSDPIAPQVAGGLLQKVAMTAAPDLLMQEGLSRFEAFGGPFTPEQRQAVDRWLPELRRRAAAGEEGPEAGPGPDAGDEAGPFAGGLLPVKTVDVLGGERRSPLIAFYAAGIGVMFLLFSAVGAAGAILEEQESGTLDRVLTTRLGPGGLLLGKWLLLTLIGVVQLIVMFIWGALVFGLELAGHVTGFLLMASFTAAAAAGFGLIFAAVCRTRRQLHGVTTIVILVMSALGGSMFPRFLMSPTMQKLGLLTFNGWALDGFIKVFWRNEPPQALWPQLAVLAALTAAFLVLSRRLARW